jgi:hypothetical protein
MAVLESGIVLAEGEELISEIVAEMFPRGNGLLGKLISGCQKLIAKLTGTKLKGYMVVTNKRVIVITDSIVCWCVNVSHSVDYIFAHHVRSLGYQRAPTCGLFCPEYSIYLTTFTSGWEFVVKGADEASISKAVGAISYFLSGTSAKSTTEIV